MLMIFIIFLYSLHVFVGQNIDDNEMLWPFSMPPQIEDESDIKFGLLSPKQHRPA